MQAIEFGGQPMHLLGGRALWWPARRALVCSDLHLGKDASFRAHGVAIPPGSDKATLARLSALLTDLTAAELIVPGDLFHARHGLDELRSSLAALFFHNLRVPRFLIPGNHDLRAKDLAVEWGFELVPEGTRLDGIALHHEPPARRTLPVIAGHWHPSVRLPAGARSSLRLPAFLLRKNLLVLPAFGEFTGTAHLTTGPRDRIFACIPSPEGPAVREIPARQRR